MTLRILILILEFKGLILPTTYIMPSFLPLRPCLQKKSVNRKPFLGRTIFFTDQNYLTNLTKLQKWHQEDLEAYSFLSGYKILCSLTAILHRVILLSECDQLLFFKWYFWLQENFLVSQVRTSHKFSNFFAFFWQTPFFVVVCTRPNNIKLLSIRWFC